MPRENILSERESINPMPAVSVLLPVYNGARFLNEAVQSILDQTFRDFELLAVDDGSSDDSLAILRNFERQDSRVRVETRENRGLVFTLNQLISIAKGQFLARMDADDISMPHRFAEQVDFLQIHPEVQLVGTSVTQINAAGLKIGHIRSPLDHGHIEAQLLDGHCPICHPAVMMRAKAIAEIGGYREEFRDAEDFDLWLRLSEVGKLANLSESLLLYRLHSGSVSETAGLSQRDATKRAVNEAWTRRGIEGKFHSDEHWRPDNTSASKHRFALQYGWTAWAHGFTATWRAYAWEAVRTAPLSPSTWKLIVLGFLRRPDLHNLD